jgi:SAM-dependent methyltransferase
VTDTGRDAAGDAADPARRLKDRWTKLADTRSCRFFVASCAGWRDPDRYRAQADADVATMLTGLDEAWLRGVDVLEIGCGVGRLAVPLLERVASYSGCDISPGMVAEARAALAADERARVVESDGNGIPAALADRRYGLIVSWAVLIHCPRPVIERTVADAIALLAPGGRLRCQILADLDDPTGIEAAPAETAALHEQMLAVDAFEDEAAAEPEDRELASEVDYLGYAFRYDEARAFFDRPGGQATLYRFDRRNLYCDWVRDEA